MDHIKIFHFIVVVLVGWVNRHQQAIINDYLIEVNRVFKQQLEDRRLRLSDKDRRRLAAKAKALGRSVLLQIILQDYGLQSNGKPRTIFTHDCSLVRSSG